MTCVVSPDASEAIRHVLFSPEACAAIWLMLFILPNATVAKWHVMLMCCLFSPNAYMAIWHILIVFVLPDAPVGYMACVVLSSFRLTPPWLYGLCCFVVLSPNASVAIRHVLFPPEACWLYGICVVYFRLMPTRLYGVCCLSSPDACMAIWHILIAFVFA